MIFMINLQTGYDMAMAVCKEVAPLAVTLGLAIVIVRWLKGMIFGRRGY